MSAIDIPLRFRPLGGNGEMGPNAMVVTLGDTTIVIDDGVGFRPDGTKFYVSGENFPDRVDVQVLTHAHLDHIGAIAANIPRPYTATPPLVASPYVQAFLKREGLAHFRKGGVTVSLCPVPHSVYGARAVIISDGKTAFVHAGEFNSALDEGKVFKDFLKTLRAARECHETLILALDATPFARAGIEPVASWHPIRERVLAEIRACAETAAGPSFEGRVFITTFGSNLPRLRWWAKAARAFRLRLFPLGRSIFEHLRAARDAVGEQRWVGTTRLNPKEKITPQAGDFIALTGSQGEPNAALTGVVLRENDVVAFSASVIPGLEDQVADLVNALIKYGVTVVLDERTTLEGLVDEDQIFYAPLHVSGHAGLDDIQKVLSAAKPDIVIPVHGDKGALRACASYVQERGQTMGYTIETPIVLNGGVLTHTSGEFHLEEEPWTPHIQVTENETVEA